MADGNAYYLMAKDGQAIHMATASETDDHCPNTSGEPRVDAIEILQAYASSTSLPGTRMTTPKNFGFLLGIH